MYPDDRVLVGVIKRKKDRKILLSENWYRIPQDKMPDGIYAEYLAFFLSQSAASDKDSSGIYYFGRKAGVELLHRRDLLPNEKKNPDGVYYKIQLESVSGKVPPITNNANYRFAFIFTTWDRFLKARDIPDLYSQSDYFVDRIYHALRDKKARASRYWDANKREYGHGAGFRFVCEEGTLGAYAELPDTPIDDDYMLLDSSQSDDAVLEEIQQRIASMGGLVSLSTASSNL